MTRVLLALGAGACFAAAAFTVNAVLGLAVAAVSLLYVEWRWSR